MNTIDTNGKKNLKQQRVSAYFIQAAKEIILAEGVESVSVRKVADRAGYAFSTIYKHYRDLDALLQDVKAAMIRDIFITMQGDMPEKILNLDDIKKMNRVYAAYYLDRPHVFRFFYSYRLHPTTASAVDLPDFSAVWQTTFQGFVRSGTIRAEDIPLISKTIIYTLQGLLALYFAGYGMTAETLFIELDQITDYLLGERTFI